MVLTVKELIEKLSQWYGVKDVRLTDDGKVE